MLKQEKCFAKAVNYTDCFLCKKYYTRCYVAFKIDNYTEMINITENHDRHTGFSSTRK